MVLHGLLLARDAVTPLLDALCSFSSSGAKILKPCTGKKPQGSAFAAIRAEDTF